MRKNKTKFEQRNIAAGPMTEMISKANKAIDTRKKDINNYYKTLPHKEAEEYKKYMSKAMNTKILLDKQPKGESIRTEIVRADNNSTIKNFENAVKTNKKNKK